MGLKYSLWIILLFISKSSADRECSKAEKAHKFLNDTIFCKVPYKESPLKAMYGCFTQKACISVSDTPEVEYLPNCIEAVNCSQLVAYHVDPKLSTVFHNKAIELDMYTAGKTSILVGISEQKRSKSHFAIKCEHSQGHAPRTILSWFDTSNTTDLLDQNSPLYQLHDPLWTSDAIYCKISLKLKFSVENPMTNRIHRFDFERKKYSLSIYTYKNAETMNGTGTYSKVHNGSSLVSLNTRFEPTSEQQLHGTYHGILMVVAWVFLIPVTNFIGRHFRKTYTGKCCKVKSWLIGHVLLAYVAIVPLVGAYFYRVIYFYNWTSKFSQVQQLPVHAVLGYAGTGLFCINLLGGCFVRSKSGSSKKLNVMAYLHSVTCETATVMCGIVVSISPGLPFTTITCSIREVSFGWLIWYIVANMLMSYNEFWIPAIMGRKEDLARLMSNTELVNVLTAASETQNKQKSINREPAGYTKARTVALFIFICVALICTVTLSLMLYFPPEDSCYKGESTQYFEKVASEEGINTISVTSDV